MLGPHGRKASRCALLLTCRSLHLKAVARAPRGGLRVPGSLVAESPVNLVYEEVSSIWSISKVPPSPAPAIKNFSTDPVTVPDATTSKVSRMSTPKPGSNRLLNVQVASSIVTENDTAGQTVLLALLMLGSFGIPTLSSLIYLRRLLANQCIVSDSATAATAIGTNVNMKTLSN